MMMNNTISKIVDNTISNSMDNAADNIPQGYKKTVLGVIPEDWEVVKLGDVVTVTTGSKNTQDKIKNGKYLFFVRSQTIERINTYSFDGEAILTAGDGVGVGKVFHYINGRFDFHQRVYKISDFNPNINARFLYWYFSRFFYDRVMKMNAKTSVDSVRLDMIVGMQIPLPKNILEQQKIAEIISCWDNTISKQEALIKQKQLFKKVVMQQIFSQQLRFKADDGSDYPDWEEKRLGELISCLDHKRKPLNSEQRANITGIIPYYGANGVVDYITDFIFNEELVLLAEDGGNFDDYKNKPIAQYITGKAWVNNHAHVIKGKDSISTKFIFYSLVHKDIRAWINGTSRSKLNKTDMLCIIVNVPLSVKEQQKIADFLTSIDEQIELLKQELEQLRLQKKSLMQKLLTGRVRVKL